MSAEAKGPSDHLYWARNKSTAKPVEHKPLDQAAIEALKIESANSRAAAWNKAATWEEKNISKWAHDHLTETLLPEVCTPIELNRSLLARLPSAVRDQPLRWCQARVICAKSVSGDVTYVFSRGKQRVVFELKLKLKLELDLRGEGNNLCEIISGELQAEVSIDDLDDSKMPSPKATCDQSGTGWGPFFQAAAPQLWPALVQVLKQFINEAKQKWQ
mmetsp:Transcript_14088/g.23380  ORF Transcript_14088/g.23380 Transcript_14088/m.23380 type:complete len:216 (+) Transcript_14088:55-702(+)